MFPEPDEVVCAEAGSANEGQRAVALAQTRSTHRHADSAHICAAGRMRVEGSGLVSRDEQNAPSLTALGRIARQRRIPHVPRNPNAGVTMRVSFDRSPACSRRRSAFDPAMAQARAVVVFGWDLRDSGDVGIDEEASRTMLVASDVALRRAEPGSMEGTMLRRPMRVPHSARICRAGTWSGVPWVAGKVHTDPGFRTTLLKTTTWRTGVRHVDCRTSHKAERLQPILDMVVSNRVHPRYPGGPIGAASIRACARHPGRHRRHDVPFPAEEPVLLVSDARPHQGVEDIVTGARRVVGLQHWI
jgi:hypothetical protein